MGRKEKAGHSISGGLTGARYVIQANFTLYRLLEAHEVAAMLAVPVSWVRAETRAGRMPVVELGRYRRYALEDVLAWVESAKRGTPVWRNTPPPEEHRSADPSRGYFPRAVFVFGFGFVVLLFGFGFVVLPVLPSAASFFGRFGDTGSLLPWLAVPG